MLLRFPNDNTLQQRQKQIDLGRQSREYCRYTQCVSRNLRNPAWKAHWHPVTPQARGSCSTRAFRGALCAWRRQLHLWGNLDDDSYDFLLKNPHLYPPDVIRKTASLKRTTDQSAHFTSESSTLCVPPVCENSAVLALYKPDSILQASSESAKKSRLLANSLLLHFEEKPIRLGLPVAFLPAGFRGMQIWPKCFFVMEEDLQKNAVHYHKRALQKLRIVQEREPQILGTACITKVNESLRTERETTVIDKSALRNILQHTSLSDQLRLSHFSKAKPHTNSSGADMTRGDSHMCHCCVPTNLIQLQKTYSQCALFRSRYKRF